MKPIEFHAELQRDVIATAGGDVQGAAPEHVTREEAFTQIVAEDLSQAGVLESPLVYYCEGGTRASAYKVNGFAIPEDDRRLDLIVTLYFPDEEIRKINSVDIERALSKVTRFYTQAGDGKFVQSLEPNSEAYAMASRIHEERDKFDTVQLLVLSNAVLASRGDIESETQLDGRRILRQVWDLERLRRLRASRLVHEPIEVDLTAFVSGGIPCVSSRDEQLGYQTCLALLPGSVLYKLYDDYAGRILELNVRSYLQARGKINAGILETLTREPEKFLAYNNGITLVAEEIRLSSDGLRILSLHGVQIVNGGQTTASIHRAKVEQKVDISHVYVQAKLTVVPAEQFEQMVPDISRYSNTQNKVTEVDLGANHPYHIGVERLSLRQWGPGEKTMWFYERARGSYQTARFRSGRTDTQRKKFDIQFPPNQRFTKEDLSRFQNTWAGLPHVVSRGGQKNFVRFMQDLGAVPKGWEPSTAEFKAIIGKAIFYREIERIARELKIGSFRVNIVTYTASLISESTARRIDLTKLWELQQLPEALASLVRRWMPEVAKILVETAGTRNPTEWFKVEGCWETLKSRAAVWTLPEAVADALQDPNPDGPKVSPGEANNIARCMELSAEQWFQIALWGGREDNLKTWESGIANTLSGYAAAGWVKRPSPKQATHGVRMISVYAQSK
jgi:hypothetical protein